MLKFENVSFSFGEKKILSQFSFHLKKGEILAIMGASGLGKTTLLNLSAGLKKPQDGQILCNAKKISYAFQEPRLFPWLNVKENVNAVLSAKSDTNAVVLDALRFVSLADSTELYPKELSGGMKSRVSLARALAHSGDLYLLDEPFAALDEALKAELIQKLRSFFKDHGASVLFVTHQRADAEALADRILEL